MFDSVREPTYEYECELSEAFSVSLRGRSSPFRIPDVPRERG
jgi:hypothetical protein